jgi:hypothetical protein
MNPRLDVSRFRGATSEDDSRIVYALRRRERLFVDDRNRVWNQGGVYFADVRPATSGEDSIESLLEDGNKHAG